MNCCLVRLAMTLWIPIDLIWCWISENREDRDIEAQRRDLDQLAAGHAAKIGTRPDDLLGGPQ